MKRVLVGLALLAHTAGVSMAGSPGEEQSSVEEKLWSFRVYLDDTEIGRHSFRVKGVDGRFEIASEASFDVRLFGLSLYSYDHVARETWHEGCLASLESTTNDNGIEHRVEGRLGSEAFELTRGSKRELLPACTMTFAYWNPRLREQQQLLNPQTGEYLRVSIEHLRREQIDSVRGKVDAEVYAIRGDGLEIEVWYAVEGDRWLQLASRTNGRRLRYVEDHDGTGMTAVGAVSGRRERIHPGMTTPRDEGTNRGDAVVGLVRDFDRSYP